MLALIGSNIFIVIMLVVNFGISWWNARSVGKMWSESKAIGGFPRVLTVSGYIMAVAGFTIVYVTILMFIVGYVGPRFGLSYDTAYTLLSLIGDLSYVLIMAAIIPTGIIIWINSLIVFWRHKSLRTGGVALWNTFATVSNVISATRNMPSAINGIKRALSSDRGNGNIVILALIIVLAAILGGYFTASAIVHKQDREYDFVERVTGQKLA